MKPLISISSKKHVTKLSTQKTNKMNTIESPATQDKPHVIKDSTNHPQEESNNINNTLLGGASENSLPNSMRPKSPIQIVRSSEEGNKYGSLESIDMDNKFSGMFKRVSLDRSLSFDDSGFSSCTSDDRDEASERLSFDLAFLSGDEDENTTKILRQIPLRLRQRSYSLDSESSDYSESYFPNAITRSSSSTYSDLSKNLVLWRDSNSKLFSEDCNNSLRLKDKVVKLNGCEEKAESVSTVSEKLNVTIPLIRPAIQRRKRALKDHNNNGQSTSSIKNLRPYQGHASPCMNSYVKGHGLLTLISCIFYTLFLGLIVGVCGLFFQVIKSFLNKEDLQDLRKTVNKSRLNEKQLNSLKKENGSLTHKRRIRQ